MIFLDKNENSILQPRLQPSEWAMHRYSFEHNEHLHEALAKHFCALVSRGELQLFGAGTAAAISPADFILGTGSSDVMVMAFCALRRKAELAGKKLVIFAQWPTFEVVLELARAQGIEVVYTENLLADFAAQNARPGESPFSAAQNADADAAVADAPALAREEDYPRESFIRLHYFCNPNNPTGLAAGAERLERLAEAVAAGDWAILDEAYAEFNPAHRSLALKTPRVLHLRTFSKAFALAGARIGYGLADAEFIGLLAPFYNPDRINFAALFAAIDALADTEFLPRLQALLAVQKSRISDWLSAAGVAFLPGAGNFIFHALTPAGAAASASALKIAYQSAAPSNYQAHMYERGIAVARAGAGLARFGRVSVGSEAETTALLAAWELARRAGWL